MSAQYQRFLKVLEKWPAEKTKIGRTVYGREEDTSWLYIVHSLDRKLPLLLKIESTVQVPQHVVDCETYLA